MLWYTIIMKIQKDFWAKAKCGEAVDVYTLSNAGIALKVVTYGGIWLELKVPDSKGQVADVALSLDTLAEYQSGEDVFYLGALIGRVANRIGGAKFKLGDKTYNVSTNRPPNQLHGGEIGFDKRIWSASIQKVDGVDKLKLSLVSPDGEEGYSGTLKVDVYHYITDDGGVELEYVAVSDKDTLCNLTQHNYFNLDGHNSGDILEHELQINGDYVTEIDKDLIPTGKKTAVKGTAFDFTKSKKISKDVGDPILAPFKGYDVNYILNGKGLKKAAVVKSQKSGRVMEVWTTKPSIQFYGGNYFDKFRAKGGAVYNQYAGLALETQFAPDGINHGDNDAILKAGEVYRHKTVYKFG